MNLEQLKLDWLKFGEDLIDLSEEIIQQANFPDAEKHGKSPKIIAMCLLCRTMNSFAAMVLVLRQNFIVEARTLARCCYENFFWIGGLTGLGDEFVSRMVEEDAAGKLKRGNELLDWAKKYPGTVDYEAPLKQFLDDLKKIDPKSGTVTHKTAADAGKIGDAYIIYRVLSTDAAHPSVTSLSRHLEVADEDDEDDEDADFEFQTAPAVHLEEVVETLEFACSALLGTCVGTNALVGGTPAGSTLSKFADRFKQLSNARKG